MDGKNEKFVNWPPTIRDRRVALVTTTTGTKWYKSSQSSSNFPMSLSFFNFELIYLSTIDLVWSIDAYFLNSSLFWLHDATTKEYMYAINKINHIN